jgi:hypothetical protein
MGLSARAFAQAHFAVETIADRFENVFADALAHCHAGGR